MDMINFDFIESDKEKVDFINEIGQLVKDGEITPMKLNETLANFYSIGKWLNVLSSSNLRSYENVKLEYKVWYAKKFLECKNILSADVPKSKTISTTEIDSYIICHYEDEYCEWQQKLTDWEIKKDFYFELKDSWKSNSKQIIELSQNMRTELMTLRVEDRANRDLKKECITRRIDIDDDYCDSEEPKKKKIKVRSEE